MSLVHVIKNNSNKISKFCKTKKNVINSNKKKTSPEKENYLRKTNMNKFGEFENKPTTKSSYRIVCN